MAKTTIDEVVVVVVVVLGRKTDTDTIFHSEKEEGESETRREGRLRPGPVRTFSLAVGTHTT